MPIAFEEEFKDELALDPPMDEDEAVADPDPEVQGHDQPRVVVMAAPPPPSPSAEERARHEVTHVPYAPWCEVCRASRLRGDPHRPRDKEMLTDQEALYTEVQVDYAFASGIEGNEPRTVTILTARAVQTGWSGAIPVPAQGAIKFAVAWLTTFLRGMGSRPFKLRHDAEPSIAAVAVAAAAELNNGSITQEAPKGAHQSVGVVERYHQELQAVIRAQRTSLEQRLGVQVSITSSLFTWLARHAAWCLPRYGLTKGTNPYQSVFGVQYVSPILNFGERVLGKDMSVSRSSRKSELQIHEGWWLGRAESTNERNTAREQWICD